MVSSFAARDDIFGICEEICKADYSLLEVLGDYLSDETQSDPVRLSIEQTFANICAEPNENLKHAVL